MIFHHNALCMTKRLLWPSSMASHCREQSTKPEKFYCCVITKSILTLSMARSMPSVLRFVVETKNMLTL